MKTFQVIVILCATLITCKASEQKKVPVASKRFGSNIDYDDVYPEQQPQRALGNQYPINNAQQSNLQGPVQNNRQPGYPYNQPVSNFNQYPQSGSNQYPISGSSQYPNNLGNGQYPINNYPSNTNGQYPAGVNAQYPQGSALQLNGLPTANSASSVNPSSVSNQYPNTYPTPNSCCANAVQFQGGQNSPINLQAPSVSNAPVNLQGTVNPNIQTDLSQYPVNNRIQPTQNPIGNNQYSSQNVYPLNGVPYPQVNNAQYPINANAQYAASNQNLPYPINTQVTLNPNAQYQPNPQSQANLLAQYPQNSQYPQMNLNSNTQYSLNPQSVPNANVQFQGNTQNIPIANAQYPPYSPNVANANSQYPAVQNVQNPNAQYPQNQINNQYQVPVTQPNIPLAATDQIVFPGQVNGGYPNQNQQNFNVNNAAATNQSPYPVANQNFNQGFPGSGSSFGSSQNFNQAQNPSTFQGQVFPSNAYPNQMQAAGEGTLDQFTQYPNSQNNPSLFDYNLPFGSLFNRVKEDEATTEKKKDTTTVKPESQTEKEVKVNEISNKKDEPKENSIPNTDDIQFPNS